MRDVLPVAVSVLVLVALVMGVYVSAGDAGFINWDDDSYVRDNPNVLGGLSADGWRAAWALYTPPYYIPVTWLSFMLNAEYAGADAGAYHLTNVVLHAANVLLLFGLFRAMTGAPARALLLAALFAVHPLHVEGVMWIAQRKEVLSTFFGLLAIVAYLGYVERAARGQRAAARAAYLALLLATLLSLLSKPMWLTLPALLLVLDGWPLGRLGRGWWPLLREKIPLGLLCAGVLALNVIAFDWDAPQLAESIDVNPFAAGWGTIPVSYALFVWKTALPFPLAVPYTIFDQAPAWWAVCLALAVLFSLSMLAWWRRAQQPWLLAGWAWFVIAAATVLFSFGSGKVTPLADHWTYVPHIGLFAALVWTLPLTAPASPRRRRLAWTASVVVVLGFALIAHLQTRHWRDAPALWAHSIAVTEGNHVAHWLWGVYAWEQGDHQQGERLMRTAQQLNPGESFYVHRLGNLLLQVERGDDAVAEYRRLLKPPLASARVLTAVGLSLLRKRDAATALPFLRRALALATDPPARATARFYLWLGLTAVDLDAEAAALLESMVQAEATDHAAFCDATLALLGRLGTIDPAWLRYLPSAGQACQANLSNQGQTPTRAFEGA